MLKQLKFIGQSALQIIYPNLCFVCHKDLVRTENYLCAACEYDLPFLSNTDEEHEKLAKLFYGRVKIEKVYALFNYQKGNAVQTLLHQIKYKGKTKIAHHYGQVLAASIKNENTFDFIIPIPLHAKKLKKRGFNQSAIIAQGIAESLGLKIEENLIHRITHNKSQTGFSKYDRFENVRKIFEVRRPELLKNKHILLVDDVLTTGATIEACAAEILQVENCKISIATLAVRI